MGLKTGSRSYCSEAGPSVVYIQQAPTIPGFGVFSEWSSQVNAPAPIYRQSLLFGWKSPAHGGPSIKLLLGPTRTRGPYKLEIGFLTGSSRGLL